MKLNYNDDIEIKENSKILNLFIQHQLEILGTKLLLNQVHKEIIENKKNIKTKLKHSHKNLWVEYLPNDNTQIILH